MSEIPQGFTDLAWRGIDHKTTMKCGHGKEPRRYICSQGKHIGRRFLGCPLKVSKICIHTTIACLENMCFSNEILFEQFSGEVREMSISAVEGCSMVQQGSVHTVDHLGYRCQV